MKSLWDSTIAKRLGKNPLKQRVYTSRLLGQNEDLVMHGGGNTSVKINQRNIYGDREDILYVKGSGWNLGTIEAAGFAPVKLKELHRLAELPVLSDMDMVKYQRMAMIDPNAPNPSVEAILHAIIPYRFVDHTHADAVVTITNTPGGKALIESIYGSQILIIPYVMPGFILAKKIKEMTATLDWSTIDGMILMNHGVFTFHDDAKVCYENMIKIVTKAEQYLNKETNKLKAKKADRIDHLFLAGLRKQVSDLVGKASLAHLDQSRAALGFSQLKNAKPISGKGPLTPDHIIRTKRTPLFLSNNSQKDLNQFKDNYLKYFNKYNRGETCLNPSPMMAIWPNKGSIAFGSSIKAVTIIKDIARHTVEAIARAEQLGGWKALPQRDLFEMEYWSLEQAKLKNAKKANPMDGKVALVTGAAGGIGKACVESLVAAGAVVAALDINPKVSSQFQSAQVIGIQCDVSNKRAIAKAIEKIIEHAGGLDMIVSNAGIFPPSRRIVDMAERAWDKSLAINLTSHQQLLKASAPYLELGIDPAVVIIGSKNVPAPGPGAAAYSVAKAGLTQLARVAAMEFGPKGIRVNTIHPNAVYDTGIWTDQVLQQRANHYGLTVEEYKTNNILKTEVSSKDVAELAVAMLSKTFSKITGAQVPIDGGNDRVI